MPSVSDAAPLEPLEAEHVEVFRLVADWLAQAAHLAPTRARWEQSWRERGQRR